VLTLRKTDSAAIVSVSTGNQPIEDLLTKEWLLTNERGSYASSTIAGCNTSSYHGLLIGSLRPPVNRVMALANCLEMLIFKKQVFNLSTFEFSDKFAPAGFTLLKQFRRDTGVHFDYELENVKLTKSVYLLRDTDTVALVYDFTGIEEPAKFVLRPFVGLRDFHILQKSYAPLCSSQVGDGVLIRHNTPNSCELLLNCPSTNFEKDPQWWFSFVYRNDRDRGQNFTEDLWTPGFFRCRIDSSTKIVLWSSLSSCVVRPAPAEAFRATAGFAPTSAETSDAYCEKKNTQYDIQTVCEDLRRAQEDIKRKAKSVRGNTRGTMRKPRIENQVSRFEILCLAADQFIVTRHAGAGTQRRVTILAGYPWFADWGRDAFIALPGLLLSTGRFDEAKSVLITFAAAADEGMIPNRFDDRSDTTYFNSVDASFWFINAAFQYLQASGDSKTFMRELMPTIRWIIDSYHKGTRFGIHAEADGLITAGNNETQLTWMDAKYGGIAFTPRCGKAVEVNALWYNSLCLLAQFYADRDIESAKYYKSMADKVQSRFCELFWNQRLGYLNDCISPDGSVDESLRPNQIFAVSLPFSPLSREQQKSVVDVVQKELLTPYGLRTLNVQDTRYRGRCTGPQQQRDEAYHQGTVWPYLMGAFVESFLKVNEFSRKSRQTAAEFIEPLLQHLTEDGCLWSISEIFDGDDPHIPRGCTAQAWSVAELIRAYQLINS
jgi:glycogen debranching enzyme